MVVVQVAVDACGCIVYEEYEPLNNLGAHFVCDLQRWLVGAKSAAPVRIDCTRTGGNRPDGRLNWEKEEHWKLKRGIHSHLVSGRERKKKRRDGAFCFF